MAKNTWDDALNDVLLTMGKIETAVGDIDKVILRAAANSRKLADKPLEDPIPKEVNTRLEKNAEFRKQVNAQLKEQERLEKALASAQAKFYSAQSGHNKDLQKTRIETNILNKAKREEAELSSKLVGEYRKQSIVLNQLRAKYKDMVLVHGENHKEVRQLKNEVTQLDDRLKHVDATVGQHQRNVGNYSSAIEGLHPGLGRVNQGLMAMGLSLDDLAASKDPFKQLATSVVAFGKATMAFLLSPVGMAIVALGAMFMLIKRNKDTVIEFDSGLRDVGKTTGLAGAELEALGDNIVLLSRRLKVVGTPALLGYATVAGQLGVKGAKNILNFSEALAKLEIASNISGEEGAAQIARLLTLTDGGVENVADFGDEIVILGNNFAATEKEILGNATAIAQNTAVYKVGRKDVLAYATATKAVGAEAELTGSTIGRTLGQFEKSIRTGKNLETIVRLTGKNAEELKTQFSTDASGVFKGFIAGLNEIDKAGGSVNQQLESIGITSVRDQRILGSLATAGFDVLTDAIEKTKEASGSLDEEFGAASGKLDSQLSRMGIAWDNLVLTIENGQGPIGKFFGFLAGFGADAIESLTVHLTFASAIFSGLGSVISQVIKEIVLFTSTIASLADIEIDFMNPGKMAASAKKVLGTLKTQIGEGGKNIGGAFMEGFTSTMGAMGKETELKKIAKERAELKKIEDQLTKEQLAAAKKALEERIRLLKLTAKEEFELGQFRLKNSIDTEKKILESKDLDSDTRLEANQRLTDDSIELLELERDSAIENAEGRTLAIQKINEEFEVNKLKLIGENEEKVKEIYADSFKAKFEEFGNIQAEDAQLLDEEVAALKRSMMDKGASVKEIEDAITALKRDNYAKQLQAQIDFAMKELQIAAITGEEQEQVAKKLHDLKMKLLDEEYAAKKDGEEESAEIEKNKAEVAIETAQMVGDAIGGISDIFSASSDAKIAKYDQEIDANNAMYDAILKNGNLTEKQREEHENEREKKNKEIENKRNEERTKQARLNKAAALTEIAINTAIAISKVLGQTGIFGLAAWIPVAALGALQAATVAAQPIPKYKDGRKGGKEELAITGDGNVNEFITDSSGKLKGITPNKPTLTHLSAGDSVLPNLDSYLDSLNLDDLNRASVMLSLNAQNRNLEEKKIQVNLDKEILKAIKEGNEKKQAPMPMPDYDKLARQFAKEMTLNRRANV